MLSKLLVPKDEDLKPYYRELRRARQEYILCLDNLNHIDPNDTTLVDNAVEELIKLEHETRLLREIIDLKENFLYVDENVRRNRFFGQILRLWTKPIETNLSI
jgi:hypothetical protein